MTFVSTLNGGINLAATTHWRRTGAGAFRFHFVDGTTLDRDLGVATADRMAATVIPAPAGYELIGRFADDDGYWRQPVVTFYVDVVVGLLDAAGIDVHLSDRGSYLLAPDGQVFDLCDRSWQSVDEFLADIEHGGEL